MATNSLVTVDSMWEELKGLTEVAVLLRVLCELPLARTLFKDEWSNDEDGFEWPETEPFRRGWVNGIDGKDMGGMP